MLALMVAAASGCVFFAGPSLGVGSIPFPVLPNHQQKAQDHFDERTRYNGVPILDPITDENHISLDPPSDDRVVRMLEKVRPVGASMPFLETTVRNIKGIEKNLIADFVDPVRVFPLVGPANLHHVHYECIVHFEEITHVGWPIPHMRHSPNEMEVLRIDMDHLHRVGGGNVSSPSM
jgi:hypothetical protein